MLQKLLLSALFSPPRVDAGPILCADILFPLLKRIFSNAATALLFLVPASANGLGLLDTHRVSFAAVRMSWIRLLMKDLLLRKICRHNTMVETEYVP